jgi:hypothetical protein
MKYVKVHWTHNDSTVPVWLYSELDDERWETRKIEVYSDGSLGFASDSEEVGGSSLGTERFPSFGEIAEDPQFIPSEIESAEFEELWSRRFERVRKIGS